MRPSLYRRNGTVTGPNTLTLPSGDIEIGDHVAIYAGGTYSTLPAPALPSGRRCHMGPMGPRLSAGDALKGPSMTTPKPTSIKRAHADLDGGVVSDGA